jgi:hypothetical protein
VTAGTRLAMALATEEEARYRPSKYKFWFNVMLQHISQQEQIIKRVKRLNQFHILPNEKQLNHLSQPN